MARAATSEWCFEFNFALAEAACEFIERLPHVKGEWAREVPGDPRANKLHLEGWQCLFVASIFGWVHKETGLRRFREATLYVPRKNATSTLASGIGWFMFAMDGEPGSEVYSGATSEKQAWEVFGPARQIGLKMPKMTKGLGIIVNASNIIDPGSNSKFEPVIGKPGDGASPHCAIVDEFHEHPTAALRDTMQTGMGARKQPLLLKISTAGDNIAGPCRDDWLELEKILAGTIEDDTIFGLIYSIDDGDDWTSEAALRKANPNFDVSVSGDFLRQQQRTAIRDARKQGIFKIKHLNRWVTARNAYFNVETWRNLKDPNLKREDFAGKRCFLGVDLAAKVDLAVWMELYPLDEQRVAVFGNYYVPGKTVEMPENQHYQKWEREGYLLATPGNMTDLTQFRADVMAFSKAHEVKELAYDPDGATLLVQDLTMEGVKCVEMAQTYAILSDPMKQLFAMIESGWIVHNGDPILEWAMSNVQAATDKQDRVKPTKERAELKIDPAVGLIMALHRYINREPDPAPAGVFFG